MRKFKLINGSGAEFDLCRSDAFFCSPDGLGRNRDQDYEKSGDWLFPTENSYAPKEITGRIIFRGYESFSEFAAFVEVEPLTFCYSPRETWYFRAVTCTALTKTEYSEGSFNELICDVDFLPLGLWYDSTRVFKTEIAPEGNKFTFPFTFPFVFADLSAGTIDIKNARPREAPCKIILEGEIINPTWTLTQGGTTIMSGALAASIGEGEKIVIDAMPLTMEVAKYSAEGVRTDLSQYQDFSKETFVYAPQGASTLTVQHSGDAEIIITVEVRQYADAV